LAYVFVVGFPGEIDVPPASSSYQREELSTFSCPFLSKETFYDSVPYCRVKITNC